MTGLNLRLNARGWVWLAAVAVVLFAWFTVWCDCGPMG